MAVLYLAGQTRDEVAAARVKISSRDLIGADPLSAFVATADDQASSFAQPDALQKTCHHDVGDIRGAQLLGYRICDLTVHAWDLARAIGADEILDPELVDWVYRAMSPSVPTIGQSGWYGDGPSATLPHDTPLQRRLLDLTGRRP